MTIHALTTDKIIAVIGAGTMGAGIAQVAAAGGHTVRLYDAADGAAAAGIKKTTEGLDKLVSRGRIDVADRDAIVTRLIPAERIEDLADSAMVIEAIVENLDVKRQLFQTLEQLCGDDTILATNTSSLSITAIATGLKRPGQVVGMHFFNPAPIMKLVEVISGLETDATVAAQVFDTATRWRKHAVHARSTPGFIVNRVARPFYGEALRLLEENAADIATIDQVVKGAGGFRMGPFELIDLIGIDVNYAVSCSVFEAYYNDPRYLPSLLQKERVDGGRLGRKSGRGFYDYGDDASPLEARAHPAMATPNAIRVSPDCAILKPLIERFQRAGIEVTSDSELDDVIQLPTGTMALTDGRTATRRGFEDGIDNLVLIDLCLDYAASDTIAISASLGCDPQVTDEAAGLLKAAGLGSYLIADTPALIVMRLVSMLANESAEVVHQGICELEGVDIAMRGGVNYPRGPIEWADAIGLDTIYTVLNHLQQSYGSDRYRPSLKLAQQVYAGKPFLATEN